MKRVRVVSALFGLLALQLQADTWSVLHDNDYIFNSDDSYSAGLQINWMGECYHESDAGSFNRRYVSALSNLVASLGVSFEGRRRNGAFGMHALMITPDDLGRTEPIYDDVPYAGILSNNFTLFSWDRNDFDAYYASLGILGPQSNAESVQKNVHKLIGSTEPRGWDNQLGNRIIVQVGYVRGIRHYVRTYNDHRRLEWFFSSHLDVGNFYNGAGMGTSLRFGSHMPWNFAAVSGVLNSVTGNKLAFKPVKDPGWELRVGLSVSGIAYFYFYEEAKRLGYAFDRPRIIPIANIGASFYWDRFRIAFDLFPTRSSDVDPRSSSFGRITLTWSVE